MVDSGLMIKPYMVVNRPLITLYGIITRSLSTNYLYVRYRYPYTHFQYDIDVEVLIQF